MWSSVYLTVDDSESASRLERLKAEYSHVDIRREAANAKKELATLIARHEIDSAYQLMEEISPSTRILVEPFITQTQIHSTRNATANATLELAAAALIADGRRASGTLMSKDSTLSPSRTFDAQRLQVVFQIFVAVHQAQVETVICAIDFENGFVFFDAWQIGQEVELHNVATDCFLVAE
jgi:hypothetical protein